MHELETALFSDTSELIRSFITYWNTEYMGSKACLDVKGNAIIDLFCTLICWFMSDHIFKIAVVWSLGCILPK
jgi:hypothetical protein